MLFAWTTYYFIWIIWTRITISKQVGKVNFLTWKREFDLTGDQLQKVYILPHTVCCKPYVRAFQYKVVNSILYTNTKLYKDNKCSFCKSYPENPQSPLFCLYILADVLERLYFHFISEECVFLSLKDVITVESPPPPC